MQECKPTIIQLRSFARKTLTYLGATNFILGMKIKRDRGNMKLWLNKRKYVETIL
jgi:hypothetical protein